MTDKKPAAPLDPDQVARIVMLVFGSMDDGNPYWCYVTVKRSRYDEFQEHMQAKNYNIQNFAKDGFGEVIVSGDGAMPPTEITTEVAKMAGVPVSELMKDIDPKAFIDKKIGEINASISSENGNG